MWIASICDVSSAICEGESSLPTPSFSGRVPAMARVIWNSTGQCLEGQSRADEELEVACRLARAHALSSVGEVVVAAPLLILVGHPPPRLVTRQAEARLLWPVA